MLVMWSRALAWCWRHFILSSLWGSGVFPFVRFGFVVLGITAFWQSVFARILDMVEGHQIVVRTFKFLFIN